MNSDITKYIREVHDLAASVRSILNAAQQDPGLPQQMREDLEWELSRLYSHMGDCVASLISINVME